MPILKTKIKTPPFMSSAHFQTLYPSFFRKVKNFYFHRERLNLNDGDFIDIDISQINSDSLVVLSHGLEGCSQSSYIKGMAKYIIDNKLADVAAWNMRSCSGELNRSPFFYHGASTKDLSQVIDYLKKRKQYKKVHLVGFSLGGNLTGFYASTMEKEGLSEVHSACLFSSPLDLGSSGKKLNQSPISRLYKENFLTTMRRKALEKQKLGVLDLNPESIRQCRSFEDFDNLVTAPTNGFKNASDYYSFASAKRVIKNTTIPTLIVQAKDDPFLTKECLPFEEADYNPNILLEITDNGGHIGFMTLDDTLRYWSESRVGEFLKAVS